jgi:hypothetical protein
VLSGMAGLANRPRGLKIPPGCVSGSSGVRFWLVRNVMSTAPRTAGGPAEVLLVVGLVLPAGVIIAVALVVALPYLLVAAAVVVAFALLAGLTLK